MMNGISKTLTCMQFTIKDGFQNHTKEAAAYFFIAIITLVVSAALIFMTQVVSSGVDGSQPGILRMNSRWVANYFVPTLIFLCVGCATRRYWLVFALVYIVQTLMTVRVLLLAAISGHPVTNWLAILGSVSVYGLIMVFIPPIIFMGLCKLAALPLPRNDGWKQVIETNYGR